MPAIPQTFLDEAYARALDGTEFKLRPRLRPATL